MALARGTTLLMALDAVVIDVETTGLDPRKARVVELAAVRLERGRVDPMAAFRSLVNPGEPVRRQHRGFMASMTRMSRGRLPSRQSGRNSSRCSPTRS